MKGKRVVSTRFLFLGMASAPLALGLLRWLAAQSQRQEAVAIILVNGMIQSGDGPVRPFAMGGAYSNRIIKQFQKAQGDPLVKAVVLRVNSPGGDVTASDEIYNEVERTREQYQKVVVASMGALAASGGYYICAPADKVVANKTTLTGSLGVLSVVPNWEDLLAKLGVKTNVFKSGAHKDDTLGLRPMSDEDKRLWQSMIDDAYEQFVNVVARGRGMEVSRVRELGDGRIFTGKQAREVGLIDEFGDLPEAIELAAKLAGIQGAPRIVEYRPFTLRSMLLGSLGGTELSIERILGLQRHPTLQYLYVG